MIFPPLLDFAAFTTNMLTSLAVGSPCPERTTPADHFLDVISADPALEHGNVCDSWRWYVENTNGAASNIEANPEEVSDSEEAKRRAKRRVASSC